MALTNFKTQPQEPSFDTNLCSVHGCNNWWTVKIDRPMCSHHQWAYKKAVTNRDSLVATLKQPPVQHWQDDEVF